ncbi:MAG: hypothetical protein AAF899_13510 [Pseudomonadota bacterium]
MAIAITQAQNTARLAARKRRAMPCQASGAADTGVAPQPPCLRLWQYWMGEATRSTEIAADARLNDRIRTPPSETRD